MRADVERDTELESQLALLMDGYLAGRKEPFKQHRLHDTMRVIRGRFERAPFVLERSTLKVRASIGMGNWAVVPWVALLDTRDTTSTKKGVYVILLFRADMSGVYVTLNQGITQPMEFLGRTAARAALQQRAVAIRARFPELLALGFDIATPLELRAARDFVTGFDDSTIAHRVFEREDLGEVVGLMGATRDALHVYDRYLESPIDLPGDRASWIRTRI